MPKAKLVNKYLNPHRLMIILKEELDSVVVKSVCAYLKNDPRIKNHCLYEIDPPIYVKITRDSFIKNLKNFPKMNVVEYMRIYLSELYFNLKNNDKLKNF